MVKTFFISCMDTESIEVSFFQGDENVDDCCIRLLVWLPLNPSWMLLVAGLWLTVGPGKMKSLCGMGNGHTMGHQIVFRK